MNWGCLRVELSGANPFQRDRIRGESGATLCMRVAFGYIGLDVGRTNKPIE